MWENMTRLSMLANEPKTMARTDNKAAFVPQAATSLFGSLLFTVNMLSNSLKITSSANDRHEQITHSEDTNDAATRAISS